MLCLLLAAAGHAFASPASSGGVNALEHLDAPYLVLVSIDGLGWDARHSAKTPALDRLVAEGVTAESMRPVFPTLTFPNHYSIATGLYPADHGIVGNNFPSQDRKGWYRLADRGAVQDGRWYRGEPIWVRAERSGMVAAAFFFVGTEAAIQGVRPTYAYPFDAAVPGPARVEQALEWLRLPAERRPHVVTLYFEVVDQTSHWFGPDDPRTIASIEFVDGLVGKLLAGIDDLPIRDEVYVIVVSDHGQTEYVAPGSPFVLDEHVDIGDASVIEGGNYVMLYYDAPDAESIDALCRKINANWEHGRAYTRATAPDHWRVSDERRFPDVIIQADAGHAVVTSDARRGKIMPGAHGWDPADTGMHATFIARGPRLPAGRRTGEISVVDVYPLMLEILGLDPPDDYTPADTLLPDMLDTATTGSGGAVPSR